MFENPQEASPAWQDHSKADTPAKAGTNLPQIYTTQCYLQGVAGCCGT